MTVTGPAAPVLARYPRARLTRRPRPRRPEPRRASRAWACLVSMVLTVVIGGVL